MTQGEKFLATAIATAGTLGPAAHANDITGLDAGANQVVTIASGAQLSGQRLGPGAEKISIGWSKVDGPGEVTFAVPHAPSTAATFTAAGKYTLMLGGFDGYVYYDFVEVTVNP